MSVCIVYAIVFSIVYLCVCLLVRIFTCLVIFFVSLLVYHLFSGKCSWKTHHDRSISKSFDHLMIVA